MNDFFAGVEWLTGHEAFTGRVGVTGFCYGRQAAADLAWERAVAFFKANPG